LDDPNGICYERSDQYWYTIRFEWMGKWMDQKYLAPSFKIVHLATG